MHGDAFIAGGSAYYRWKIAKKSTARSIELEKLIKNDRLISRSDMVFTPHVAAKSVEAVQRINEMTVANIRAFLRGGPENL